MLSHSENVISRPFYVHTSIFSPIFYCSSRDYIFQYVLHYLVLSSCLSTPRYLYGLNFGHEVAQIYFSYFWQWDSMLIPPRGVRSQSRGGKLDFLVKEATKNTANTVLDREVNLHIQEN